MIVLIVIVLMAIAAAFCLRGGGDCYGNINAKKQSLKKKDIIDNKFIL